MRDKIRLIRGDITAELLNISSSDLVELKNEVSVVINSAATVRFNEPIDAAVRNNIYSVEQLINFCDQLDKLQCLIHISTAYSNCHRKDTIKEIFYEPPIRGEQLDDCLEKITKVEEYFELTNNNNNIINDNNNNKDKTNIIETQKFYPLKNYSKKLIDNFTEYALTKSDRPNTYTFTKSVSEWKLLELASKRPERYLKDKIPIAIVRPSIVGGAWREPCTGFVDNRTGPTGAIMSFYTGALQAMPGRGELVADFVPVDMVTNAVICAAWFIANHKWIENEDKNENITNISNFKSLSTTNIKPDRGAFIFNFVSGHRNPLRWHILTDSMLKMAYKYPTKNMFRLPNPFFSRAEGFYEFWNLIYHKMPSLALDTINKLKFLKHGQELDGRKSAIYMYNRVRTMSDLLSPFTSHQWSIEDPNTFALYEQLSDLDKELFSFDIGQVKWTEYMDNYIVGTRYFTMNEKENELPMARERLRK